MTATARARVGHNKADGKIAPIATATSKGNLLAAVGRQGKAMALLTWYSLYCACSRVETLWRSVKGQGQVYYLTSWVYILFG